MIPDIPTPHEHLKNYVTAKLGGMVPALFEEGPDLPSFTVDRSKKEKIPGYPGRLTINSALLG